MANVVILIILILIVGSVCFYLYKQKKNGNHCIGCSCGKQCGKKTSGECQKNCGKE